MRASSSTGAPALLTGRSLTVTVPARISARARSRDGARPRETSRWSRRNLGKGRVHNSEFKMQNAKCKIKNGDGKRGERIGPFVNGREAFHSNLDFEFLNFEF